MTDAVTDQSGESLSIGDGESFTYDHDTGTAWKNDPVPAPGPDEPTKPAGRGRRDVTRALAILEGAGVLGGEDGQPAMYVLSPGEYTEVRRILRDVDARTGRRDPSKRPAKKKPGKPGNKPARRTGAR